MAATVAEIVKSLDQKTPFNLAESWDNVGLLLGNPDQQVTGILIALDTTEEILGEALERGCNLIISHHPVIFKPLATILTDTAEGRLIAGALTNQVAIIGCHTNFDSAADGVSDYLGESIGLGDLSPLLPTAAEGIGLGRIGSFAQPLSGEAFMQKLFEVLGLPVLQIAGELPELIQRVALCGGSGSDFAMLARQAGADVYLSAEIKHATAVWARANNFCIIDGSHYATEKPALVLLANYLQRIAKECQWTIPVYESERERHPFTYFGYEM